YALGGEPPAAPDLAGLREFRRLGAGSAAGLTRIRMDLPFDSSISKEFVFRTRSLSLRKPKVLGSKSEARLASCRPTSPSVTQPSSLSIWVITFLMMGVAASGGWSDVELRAASWVFAGAASRFSV